MNAADTRSGGDAPHRPAEPRDPADSELRRLQDVHRPVLLAYVRRLLHGDARRAEQITRETLTHATRSSSARDAGGRWDRSWLFTVARQAALAQTPEAVRPDRGDALAELPALPAMEHAVIVEVHHRRRTAESTAEVLGIPADTVASHLNSALRKLRAVADRDEMP